MKSSIIATVVTVVGLALVGQANAAIVTGYSNAAFSSYSSSGRHARGYYADISPDGTTFTTGQASADSSPISLTWTCDPFSIDVAVGSSQAIAIGTLTYINGATVVGTAATEVASSIATTLTTPVSQSGSFDTAFTLTLTLNSRDSTASADVLSLSFDASTPITFTVDGVCYTISVAGFDVTSITSSSLEEVLVGYHYEWDWGTWRFVRVPDYEWESVTVTTDCADGIYDSYVALQEDCTATICLYATITATAAPSATAAVPEPGACLIWSLLGGLGFISSRRKRNRGAAAAEVKA